VNARALPSGYEPVTCPRDTTATFPSTLTTGDVILYSASYGNPIKNERDLFKTSPIGRTDGWPTNEPVSLYTGGGAYSQPSGDRGTSNDRIPEVTTIMVPSVCSQRSGTCVMRYLCAYALATSAQMQYLRPTISGVPNSLAQGVWDERWERQMLSGPHIVTH